MKNKYSDEEKSLNQNWDKYFDKDELSFLSTIGEKSIENGNEDPELETVFFDLFRNLLRMIIIADKISSIMKKTMKKYEDVIKMEESELFKKSITKYVSVKKEINESIIHIYNFSGESNYFWKDSPVEVYISHYNLIKEKYLEKFTHSNELDFIKNEIEYFLSTEEPTTNNSHTEVASNDYLSVLNYRKFFSLDNEQFFNLLKKRKIDFLKNEIEKLGYKVELEYINEKPTVKLVENILLDVEDLSLSGLPKFNLQQRYELFKKLGYEDAIHKLKTKQLSKNKILAIILGISPDNAKHLLNGSYKGLSVNDENDLAYFLDNQNIKI